MVFNVLIFTPSANAKKGKLLEPEEDSLFYCLNLIFSSGVLKDLCVTIFLQP